MEAQVQTKLAKMDIHAFAYTDLSLYYRFLTLDLCKENPAFWAGLTACPGSLEFPLVPFATWQSSEWSPAPQGVLLVASICCVVLVLSGLGLGPTCLCGRWARYQEKEALRNQGCDQTHPTGR